MVNVPALSLVLVALLAAPSLAQAQTSSTAAAESLFGEGRALMQKGRLSEACEKFAQSQALDPGAGTLLNLADCYERDERLASAWLAYSQAVALAETSSRDEWAKRARAKIAKLRPRLPTLEIRFPEPAPNGLVVTRDGQILASSQSGIAVPIDPGEHTVEAKAEGKMPFRTSVFVAKSTTSPETLQLTIPLLADEPAAQAASRVSADGPFASPNPSEDGSRPSSGRRAVAYTALAVGGVGLVVSGVAGILALNQKGSAEGHCSPDLLRCDRTGVDAMASARTSATIATVAGVVGVVGGVGGIVLLVTSPSRGPSTTIRAGLGSVGLVRSF